jgi:hypothetical protein
MDVSGRILGGWMPAIHAGMTEALMTKMPSNIGVGVEDAFIFSCSASERKLKTHFVVSLLFATFAFFAVKCLPLIGCGSAA